MLGEQCAVQWLEAMDRTLGGRRSRTGRKQKWPRSCLQRWMGGWQWVDGSKSSAVILGEKKLEQPSVARSLPQRCCGASECREQLGTRWWHLVTVLVLGWWRPELILNRCRNSSWLRLKPHLCAVMQGMHKGNGNIHLTSKSRGDERFIWEYENALNKWTNSSFPLHSHNGAILN